MKETLKEYEHRVIDGEDVVTDTEGTGLLHVAPGAGGEDFKLGIKNKLPVISSIEEDASYSVGMGEFAGKNAKKHPELIIDYLKNKDNGVFILTTQNYKHRYPTCWRCKTELVWRVVDEWYIAMDRKDNSGKTYREQMIEVANKITWMPNWGLERELDWLKNMQDWLISKKRYWGLALPIYECKKCGNFEVIGTKEELKEKAVDGWKDFEGHSPHRPWVDQVKIKCGKCKEIISRIPDVGNPWLDAGIVPFSTMSQDWFPADFITESFPGQFKNWFYALIAMSTVIKGTNPFERVLGFGSVRDEKGEEMHKSKGNAIEFNEAAGKIGVDVMRWLYLRTNPEHNINFGYHVADEIRRLFHIRLWNVYVFFVTYASLDKWKPKQKKFVPENILDRWILSRMNGNIKNVTENIENYDAAQAAGQAEIFVINDLSNWYVRRIRDRVGPSAPDGKDKDDAYETLWNVLTIYAKVLAPFMPFIAEEIYINLTGEESVHLADWPSYGEEQISDDLETEMENARVIAEKAHAKRKESEIKVRIPIRQMTYSGPGELSAKLLRIVKEEVNAYELKFDKKSDSYSVSFDPSDKNLDLDSGLARDIVRQIQEQRKSLKTKPSEKVIVQVPYWPEEFTDYIKKKALVSKLSKGDFLVKRNE